ncbi:MAG: exodeoxyribonuclease VII large subunit [Myxococcota bacterium]
MALQELEPGGAPVWSVSELLSALKRDLAALGECVVEGEISSLYRSRPGHLYFDLRDEESLLPAVLFRGSQRDLGFELQEGMQVRVRGRLDVYAVRGRLQLIASRVEPSGEGALRAAFERLKARLEAEGLFDPARKRALPFLPSCIGVVTSLGGAAIHDLLRGLRRRAVGAEILVFGCAVQGESAWREVIHGLQLLDAHEKVDVIVVTRGGGSIEDLWTFNREPVVRALAELQTPVVSAIGHEVDWVLSDLAADARAATPTAAAELLLPDGRELSERVRGLERRMATHTRRVLAALEQRLQGLRRGLIHPSERLDALGDRLGAAARRLPRAARRGLEVGQGRLAPIPGRLRRVLAARLERSERQLAAAGGRLQALSPLAVLGRGYAIARREADGAILVRAAQVEPGESIRLRLARGELRARVRSRREEPL